MFCLVNIDFTCTKVHKKHRQNIFQTFLFFGEPCCSTRLVHPGVEMRLFRQQDLFVDTGIDVRAFYYVRWYRVVTYYWTPYCTDTSTDIICI